LTCCLHWQESARLWLVLVGGPSVMRSPPVRLAAEPLVKIDAQLLRDYHAAKAEYEALEAGERKAAERPRQLRVRFEDATIEAAQEVLRDSPGGVLCLQDELSGWFGSMDKYTGQHGAAKNRGFWLQAWNGGEYPVDRIGRGAAVIENLSVSLLGGVQPEVLRKLMAGSVDDGLLQRTLIVMIGGGRDRCAGAAGDQAL
jgi:hypothetical protein